MMALGMLSVAVAAAFLWTSPNYKRMLAYSSVEHIGLVCLGLGFGGTLGTTGALLHIANHALAKSIGFLLTGRIRAAYGSAEIAAVGGLMRGMPRTGAAFLAAMLALLGLPPFGLFVSEVMIFGAGFAQGFPFVAGVALLLLVIAFAGLLRGVHAILYGAAGQPAAEGAGWRQALPVAAAFALLLLAGIAWPPGLGAALDRIAAIVVP
jgi:hydrogenase-4 component F